MLLVLNVDILQLAAAQPMIMQSPSSMSLSIARPSRTGSLAHLTNLGSGSNSGNPHRYTERGGYMVDRTKSNRALECFSCMSLEFRRQWTTLRTIYAEPGNFTDGCIDAVGTLQVRKCKEGAACATLVEPRFLGGYQVGQNVIRGCTDSIFHTPILTSALQAVATPSVQGRGAAGAQSSTGGKQASAMGTCRSMSARQLLPSDAMDAMPTSGRQWSVCICTRNRCNAWPSGSGASAHFSTNALWMCAVLAAGSFLMAR